MPAWEFLDYVTDGDVVPVLEWAENHLTIEERAVFDLAVDGLSRTYDWDSVPKLRRKYRELTRNLVGLTEIKFDIATSSMGRNFKRRFRPLGIMQREQHVFIFLGGFQKGRTGSPPIPEDAHTLALRYKQEYEDGRGTLRAHKT